MREITFTVAATRQWAKLTLAIRKRIDNKLVRYAQTGAGDVKSLSGREGARLRVGDWRVIFTEDPMTIIVVAVGHRGEIYEDRNSAMTKVQFIRTPHGDELAVLPREEYERLTALAAEAEEDAGTRRLVSRARRALDERREVAIPKAVADRIAAGENPILVVRDWRGITQVALSDAAGISQSYVADLESGRRSGSPRQLAAVAAALKVPLDLLVS